MTDISTIEVSSIDSTPSRIENTETKWELEEKPVVQIKFILRQRSVKNKLKLQDCKNGPMFVKPKTPKVSFKTKVDEIREIDKIEELEFGNIKYDRECCTMF